MARRQVNDRPRRLQAALADLKAEKAGLQRQRARVAAARRVIAALSRCDWCGAAGALVTGQEPQLCRHCSREHFEQMKQRAEQARVELLARHGYGPDGKRIAAA